MSEQPDGNLPAAREALSDAIHILVGRTTTIVTRDNGATNQHWGDSLYIQLQDSIGGNQGEGGEGTHSQPPIWIDGVQLLDEIDSAVRREQSDPGPFDGDLSRHRPSTPETVRRLHLIADRTWRPQDTNKVWQIADACLLWAKQITGLFDPPERKALPNPCPACDTQTVYRKDSTGEVVRQPALQIGPLGCECMSCHTVWAPEYFLFLATKLLGYELPQGVLE